MLRLTRRTVKSVWATRRVSRTCSRRVSRMVSSLRSTLILVLFLLIDKSHGLGGHAQGTNLVGAGPSGEFASGQYGQVVALFNANATAVEQQGGWPAARALSFDAFAEFKNAGPFEEEVALFGEEQAEGG